MAVATSKQYFYPEKEKAKKKPQRYIEQGGRKFMEKDYGWGPTLVDPNVGGSAAKYQETANKLLAAQGAEAEAREANPEAALKAQYQEAELGAISKMLGLKERQGEAGIKAMLGQLGLGEKPGGGMESVKPSNLVYQDQPPIPTYEQNRDRFIGPQPFQGPPEFIGPVEDESSSVYKELLQSIDKPPQEYAPMTISESPLGEFAKRSKKKLSKQLLENESYLPNLYR